MKVREALSDVKNFLTDGNGLYLLQQVPFIGDYYTGREFSKVWGKETENTKYFSRVAGAAVGTARLIIIGTGFAYGNPLTGVIANSAVGGIVSWNTLEHKWEGGYEHFHRKKKEPLKNKEPSL